MHENVLLALLYGFITAVLMQVGRLLLALLLGNPFPVCVGFVTTDVLSPFFAALVIWICRRLDGMLEEQTHYLKRTQKEKENQGL